MTFEIMQSLPIYQVCLIVPAVMKLSRIQKNMGP